MDVEWGRPVIWFERFSLFSRAIPCAERTPCRKYKKSEHSIMEEEKVVLEAQIATADMPDAMKEVVIETAKKACEEYSIDKDIATAIKKKFDEHEEYMGTWHCIVGKNFGCSITHETQYSIFFSLGGSHFLLFKSME